MKYLMFITSIWLLLCSCGHKQRDNEDYLKQRSNIIELKSSFNQEMPQQNPNEDWRPSYHRNNIMAPIELRRQGPDFKRIPNEN